MRLDDFDFDLPEELIALRPAEPRSAARLLVAVGERLEDRQVTDLPRLLRPGDLLIFNDTKVIPARLEGVRRRETSDGPGVARIEVTLLSRVDAETWQALARPAKRLRSGDRIRFADTLSAEVLERAGGDVTLRFDQAGAALDAAIAAAGLMPLPPYIATRRAADARDRTDYQTVFAEESGAVAAPTAGLHFDAALLDALIAAGVETARVTLHVGAGTFRPVTATHIAEHKMHAEWGRVPAPTVAAIARTRAAGGRVIAVGTTVLRILETAAAHPGGLAPWEGETDIFITPGFQFRAIDGLLTNFHLPRSTLLMLVAALIGLDPMRRIYAHAIAARYRFFSYGDASLLLPAVPRD
ncbi:MAG: tRNA preQ1(34) S-adenosylmethionine ribosyltransferase-isomerase QueA [Pseudomonadota bacterium]